MIKIEISLNGAGATYTVSEPIEEVNRQLHNIQMGNVDFLEFNNAFKGGIYPVEKLIISPLNCSIIEIQEVLT